jgi:hypothetical protein
MDNSLKNPDQLTLFEDAKGDIHRCQMCCTPVSFEGQICSDVCAEAWANYYLSPDRLKLKSNDD